MTAFAVVATEKIKDGQGTKGPFTVHKIMLDDPQGNRHVAEIFCPAGTQPPTEGTTVEGEIEKTDNPSWLDKFKPARKGGGGGYKPKPPEERRSIAMQHAQKCAVDVARLALERDMKSEDVRKVVQGIAAELFAQVQAAEASS